MLEKSVNVLRADAEDNAGFRNREISFVNHLIYQANQRDADAVFVDGIIVWATLFFGVPVLACVLPSQISFPMGPFEFLETVEVERALSVQHVCDHRVAYVAGLGELGDPTCGNLEGRRFENVQACGFCSRQQEFRRDVFAQIFDAALGGFSAKAGFADP